MALQRRLKRLEQLEAKLRPEVQEAISPEIQRKWEALPQETFDRIFVIWEAVEDGKIGEDVLKKALAEAGL